MLDTTFVWNEADWSRFGIQVCAPRVAPPVDRLPQPKRKKETLGWTRETIQRGVEFLPLLSPIAPRSHGNPVVMVTQHHSNPIAAPESSRNANACTIYFSHSSGKTRETGAADRRLPAAGALAVSGPNIWQLRSLQVKLKKKKRVVPWLLQALEQSNEDGSEQSFCLKCVSLHEVSDYFSDVCHRSLNMNI